jgi:hypothetical protein
MANRFVVKRAHEERKQRKAKRLGSVSVGRKAKDWHTYWLGTAQSNS